MSTLTNKIDFAGIIVVKHANPNGDPLNGNRPRYDYAGFGEISDVAIKRKIRNRLMQEGQNIFVQSDDSKVDGYPSLAQRATGELTDKERKDSKSYKEAACAKWIDVRSFGQLFAFKSGRQGEGVSVGIRGPVSLHPAFSVATVLDRVTSTQITKSVSGEGDGTKRASDTMGMKHRVDHGVYLFYGSMNPQLASITGFSDDDAVAIKKALATLFRNDASSARPEGSMELYRLYWWEHSNPNGQYSFAKVHRLLNVELKDGIDNPKSIDDYSIALGELPGLKCEVIEGE
jgi:CRISPR-associated protein Csd2